MVDMTGVNPVLRDVAIESGRFFQKDGLPSVETVVRLFRKKALKLTVVVAAMLLLATKEERYSSILSDLAFTGRAAVRKSAPLSSASRNEFYSASVLSPAAMPRPLVPSGRRLEGSRVDGGGATFQSEADDKPDLTEQYKDMAAVVHRDNVAITTKNRAKRMAVRRQRQLARATSSVPLAPAPPAVAVQPRRMSDAPRPEHNVAAPSEARAGSGNPAPFSATPGSQNASIVASSIGPLPVLTQAAGTKRVLDDVTRGELVRNDSTAADDDQKRARHAVSKRGGAATDGAGPQQTVGGVPLTRSVLAGSQAVVAPAARDAHGAEGSAAAVESRRRRCKRPTVQGGHLSWPPACSPMLTELQ